MQSNNQTNKQTKMKIDSATIRNFKNVRELTIEPGGQSFIVSGGNATGKSSVIQALLGTLSGERPKEVVGPDGQVAEVVVNLKGENGQYYSVAAKFQQDAFKKRAEGKIVITDQDGNKVGIKAFRYLIGNATFDVERDFLSKSPKDQVEFLKRVTGKAEELNTIERERSAKFDQRTEINRKVRDLQGELKGKEIDSKLVEIDLQPIKMEMSQIGESIKRYQHVASGVREAKDFTANYNDAVTTINNEIEALELRIQNLKERKQELDKSNKENLEKVEKGEAWLKKNPEPSMDDLNRKMDEALQNNKKVEERDAILEKHKLLKELKSKSEDLTKEIEDKDKEKAKIISESDLPVEGLTFNDDGVFLDGLPFESGQINTAKIQEVGFMLFKSLKNNIKVMKLNMSEMDKETFKKIMEEAEKSDTQIIFERVSWDASSDFEIKFTEEYL